MKETSRCNCTACGKGRFWKTMVPASDFTLTRGEKHLGDYGQNIHHRFCMTCGVKVFGPVSSDGDDLVAINVMAIEGLTPQKLAV
ncbi:MAG: GFA family protein, partial [Archangium sp.]